MIARPSSAATPLAALIFLTLAWLAAGPAQASGGYSLPGSANTGPNAPRREVDQVYEFGKSIYLGRQPGVEKITYCVLDEGKPRRLRGRNLRTYRGATLHEFANSLYNCDDTSQLALTSVEPDQVRFVLYYLNKRFNLALEAPAGSSAGE